VGITGSGTVSLAGSAAINLVSNTVAATVSGSTVTADRNVTVLADEADAVTSYAGTVNLSGAVGIGGTAVVNYLGNTTRAAIDSATTAARVAGSTVNSGTEPGRAVVVRAHQATDVTDHGGVLTFGDEGVGAAVDADIVLNTTTASVSGSNARAGGDVEVSALT